MLWLALLWRKSDSPCTRQSSVTLATFRSWGISQDDATRGVIQNSILPIWVFGIWLGKQAGYRLPGAVTPGVILTNRLEKLIFTK